MSLGQYLADINNTDLKYLVKDMVKAIVNELPEIIEENPSTTEITVFIDNLLIGGHCPEEVIGSIMLKLEDKHGLFCEDVFYTQLGTSVLITW